ncbi:hypothetical protein BCV69DRAFT_303601 [Microstroma glucosiphilum]|uniref:Apple domain-containing protein n=1 Tax=Pseudomicrostroma glucosiphilum TaxID=1684307 RepID=A0A316U4A8_9BASI|nr:hypothetical protein BCV69DRAFT_303601 [Pseudomicrostroma glucosiphilum]PWN19203.1 hypothetical protein BCV69DRAFT_303601 [Pseudomicrostroma glucosiphilum]
MKLSLTLLGLAMACLAGVKADDSTSILTADERIMLAVASTNQTGGPSPYDWPDAAPATPEVATNTSDTTVDVVSSRSEGESSKRSYKSAYNLGNIITKRHDYVTLTDGTDPRYQNAALQAPSYLTYKVISNTTSYATAKKACLAYCSSVSKCVAANMYNEIGNPLLDHTFSEKSNRKCALYGDVPTLSQMTNKGGQQLYGPNSPANCIENSAVFYLGAAAAPTTPSGYTFTFGPLDAATSASLAVGYMGYDFITQYDPNQCAKLCDARKADPVGGKCKFFNIWRGVVSGKPTTYTCSYFYQATDASTATNTGDAVNKVTVTFSRGYTRNST